MATRTVETTAAEDEAITYAYQQSQKPGLGGVPIATTAMDPMPKAADETEAQFFQRMTQQTTIGPIVMQHNHAKNTELLASMNSIPPENREAAQADIEAVITAQGGTVPLHDVTYLFSSNTAAPPRAQSVEANVNDTNLATVTKLTFDNEDAENVAQKARLLALKVNTLIRLEDAETPANFLQVILTAVPLEKQPADPYVEMTVAFHSRGGSFATLDTKPVACTFT